MLSIMTMLMMLKMIKMLKILIMMAIFKVLPSHLVLILLSIVKCILVSNQNWKVLNSSESVYFEKEDVVYRL